MEALVFVTYQPDVVDLFYRFLSACAGHSHGCVTRSDGGRRVSVFDKAKASRAGRATVCARLRPAAILLEGYGVTPCDAFAVDESKTAQEIAQGHEPGQR